MDSPHMAERAYDLAFFAIDNLGLAPVVLFPGGDKLFEFR